MTKHKIPDGWEYVIDPTGEDKSAIIKQGKRTQLIILPDKTPIYENIESDGETFEQIIFDTKGKEISRKTYNKSLLDPPKPR